MKALVIEDDPEIVESVSLAFAIGWPTVSLVSTHSGKKGIELAEGGDIDIIILDFEIPDISSLEVLRQIRLFSSVPIIILTFSGDEANIVRGLDCGADDYIVKPCGQLEFMARVKARTRDENQFAEELPLSFSQLRFSPSTRQLCYRQKEINLTAIEAHIIHHLMRSEGRVATYSSLAEEVWGHDYPGSVDALGIHIRRLRQKLEADPSHPQLILAKSGIGYFLAKPD